MADMQQDKEARVTEQDDRSRARGRSAYVHS